MLSFLNCNNFRGRWHQRNSLHLSIIPLRAIVAIDGIYRHFSSSLLTFKAISGHQASNRQSKIVRRTKWNSDQGRSVFAFLHRRPRQVSFESILILERLAKSCFHVRFNPFVIFAQHLIKPSIIRSRPRHLMPSNMLQVDSRFSSTTTVNFYWLAIDNKILICNLNFFEFCTTNWIDQ